MNKQTKNLLNNFPFISGYYYVPLKNRSRINKHEKNCKIIKVQLNYSLFYFFFTNKNRKFKQIFIVILLCLQRKKNCLMFDVL